MNFHEFVAALKAENRPEASRQITEGTVYIEITEEGDAGVDSPPEVVFRGGKAIMNDMLLLKAKLKIADLFDDGFEIKSMEIDIPGLCNDPKFFHVGYVLEETETGLNSRFLTMYKELMSSQVSMPVKPSGKFTREDAQDLMYSLMSQAWTAAGRTTAIDRTKFDTAYSDHFVKGRFFKDDTFQQLVAKTGQKVVEEFVGAWNAMQKDIAGK